MFDDDFWKRPNPSTMIVLARNQQTVIKRLHIMDYQQLSIQSTRIFLPVGGSSKGDKLKGVISEDFRPVVERRRWGLSDGPKQTTKLEEITVVDTLKANAVSHSPRSNQNRRLIFIALSGREQKETAASSKGDKYFACAKMLLPRLLKSVKHGDKTSSRAAAEPPARALLRSNTCGEMILHMVFS
jgi:hypothetical protein